MAVNRWMSQGSGSPSREKAIARDVLVQEVIPAMKNLNEALDDLVATKDVLYKEGVIDTVFLDEHFGKMLESRARLCAVIQEIMDSVNDKPANSAAAN